MKDKKEMSWEEREKKWKREDDARTLARAEEIKADATRYREAVLESQNMVDEQIKGVRGLAKVAGRAKELPKVSPVGRKNPATVGTLTDLVKGSIR